MARVRRYTVPCVMEVSSIETVTPGFDLYFIPSVLNSSEYRLDDGIAPKSSERVWLIDELG